MGNKKEENVIYIIDDEYHILHFNQALRKRFPAVQKGDICYKVLCCEEEPCKECPMFHTDGDSQMFYNKFIQQWVEINVGRMDWPGCRDCYVLMVREITQSNKNLFYNLANISIYDELFELNLTKNLYKVLYHQEGKYLIPAEEGKLSELLREGVNRLIHPDDREAFLHFWDPKTLKGRIHGEKDNVLKGQFRMMKVGEEYCWVVHTMVPLGMSNSDDEIVMCFVQDVDEQRKRELSGMGDAQNAPDSFAGIYRGQSFFLKAQEFLRQERSRDFCLMAVDIEHFKLFNEWYGQEAGDRFLADIGRHLRLAQEESGGIVGYMGGDDFVILLPNEPQTLSRLQNQILGYVKQYGGNAGFLPSFGLYAIEDRNIPIRGMYDRAAIALSMVKGNYSRRFCWYDTKMKQRMEEDHRLLLEIQRALENGEFTFYAQPKCNMSTGKVMGLESLVRWIHPKRGLIPPGEFIPLLEQNGFITNLDLYIWELVCQRVREWIDKGYRALPISVNVSRVDIYSLDVPKTFKGLVEKYGLEPRLIEIEITESAYAEEYQMITGVVEELRKAGFTVLMDDFGSGYSSLNMLKDVNVDVLKIDMKFLEMNEQSAGKGMGILEAIINMARLIGLRLIAEGVEDQKQVDFLLDMGCVYGQGYYFYRPMPIETLASLLMDENNLDFSGIEARQVERLRLRDLLNDGVFSETMMNNILGGIAFYDVCDGNIELLRVNEQYYQVTGSNPVDLAQKSQNILNGTNGRDRESALELFYQAYKNPLNGAEGDVRLVREDGEIVWIHLRTFFIREQDGHRLYYGSISDVTEQKLRKEQNSADFGTPDQNEQELRLLRHKMDSIFRQANINSLDWDMEAQTLTITNVTRHGEVARQFRRAGRSQMVLHDFPNCILRNSYIVEEYRQEFLDFLELVKQNQMEPVSCELPFFTKSGQKVWLQLSGEILFDEGGRPVRAVGYYTDITEQKLEQKRRRDSKKALELLRLQAVYDFRVDLTGDTVTFGEKEEGSWEDVAGFRFEGTYTQLIHFLVQDIILPEFRTVFREFMNREKLLRCYQDGRRMECLDYQRQYQGEPRWMRAVVHLVSFEDSNHIFAYVFVMDIDEQKRQELQLTMLAETDVLTGMYNRQAAIPKIKEYLRNMGDGPAALVMFDLDNFKQANDVFGHAYGDSIISENARKLKNCFRGGDIVCRIGGDEFLVLCKNIREEDMNRKLSSILEAMTVTYQKEDQEIFFSVSAGYAMIPEQGREFDDLYQKADIALFTAKMSGKCSYKKYNPSMKSVRYELADREADIGHDI